MQPRKRRSPAMREQTRQDPRHPVGRARRRWDRAYDGGAPVGARPPQRYRRSFDGGEGRASQGPRLAKRRSAMDAIRRHPLRHGLIGLGIAGTAVPIAVGRQQADQRTDPSHEQTVTRYGSQARLSDSLVTQAWRNATPAGEIASAASAIASAPAEAVTGATAAASASAVREAKIQENMQRHKAYNVPRDLAESIYDLALQENIDPDMAFGLVRTESAFKNSATSHVGAVGLTQLMPRTAEWLKPGVKMADLRNSETNLQIGFKYLNDLIDKYDGNEELALLAYNRGPGTVDRVLKKGGNPDNGYPDMVLRGATPRH